jgi:hypothetical protein
MPSITARLTRGLARIRSTWQELDHAQRRRFEVMTGLGETAPKPRTRRQGDDAADSHAAG